ncbi:hypothetical protein HYT92_00785 [Candidatus Pacearchaeota archaeon]|nr:hypothetical protein [Candidatus Pacearchaeota archaeon]
MAITFRYKNIRRPNGALIKSPSIPITLIGKENFDTVALVDSGADISAMPKDMAEVLGLKLDGEIEYAYGIGGKTKCVETKITILIEQKHERYMLNIPIKVILDEYSFPILLGRAGFFDEFIVSFDQLKERISLKKIERSNIY